MGKIFCVMGKSSTGKDSIYKRILENEKLGLKRMIPYTTRPIRIKETDGVEYHFCDEAKLEELEKAGKVIERRDYNTEHGIWTYFTVDDGTADDGSCMIIGTLEVYESLRDYYGAERVVPIYIFLDDGARLARALKRERKQAEPKYREMCRRFIADDDDFSAEKLAGAGIDETVSFENPDEEIEDTIDRVTAYIRDRM